MPIRHFNTGAKRRKLHGVLKIFTRELEKKLESNIKSMKDWDEVSDKKLLDLRRELVGAIKQGMFDRKDMEIEIAMLACFVWWNRLEKEKRFALEMSE